MVLDAFVDTSEEALIASPGFPHTYDARPTFYFWILIGPVGTHLVIHLEPVLLYAELTIGYGYMYDDANVLVRKVEILDSLTVTSPTNSLTLRYRSSDQFLNFGFIAHVSPDTGMILFSDEC